MVDIIEVHEALVKKQETLFILEDKIVVRMNAYEIALATIQSEYNDSGFTKREFELRKFRLLMKTAAQMNCIKTNINRSNEL